MKNYFFIQFLIASCFALTNLCADGIRLYQAGDHTVLRSMIARNEDLLVPGNSLDIRISETERFFNSEKYITKVYVKNNEPAGFITYVKDGFSAPLIDISNFDPEAPLNYIITGCIQLLSVEEKYRRQAVGQALVHNALEDMKSKEIKVIILQTKVANSAARSLYEKNGFRLYIPVMPDISDCLYRLLF